MFWKLRVDCRHIFEYLFEKLRGDLLQSRVHMYADCIMESGVPFPKCIAFMDETKIFMSWPGGSNVNQRFCYTLHKRRHCVVYLTVTTRDELILFVFGLEPGRRHNMTLYRQSGVDDSLCDQKVIDGQK